MPPPASVIAIVPGTLPPAPGSAGGANSADVDHQADFVESHVKHTGPFQTQEVAE